MKKILAVSGGVDSIVLFDYFVNGPGAAETEKSQLVVAHFDHGTRPSSKQDAEFVQRLCQENSIKCIIETANLGENVSEAAARESRYNFLSKVAEKYGGKIYTAHHQDDLLESIIINLLRGTEWRGLAPMSNQNIARPFIEKGWGKKDILKYAGAQKLKFRQDPTNNEDNYLRNRIRQTLADKNKRELQNLLKFCRRQTEIKNEVDQIINEILPKDGTYQRAWFAKMPDTVACEILRSSLLQINIRATYPQLKEFLNAIRTYAPEKSFNLPGGKLVKIHKLYYNIK